MIESYAGIFSITGMNLKNTLILLQSISQITSSYFELENELYSSLSIITNNALHDTGRNIVYFLLVFNLQTWAIFRIFKIEYISAGNIIMTS